VIKLHEAFGFASDATIPADVAEVFVDAVANGLAMGPTEPGRKRLISRQSGWELYYRAGVLLIRRPNSFRSRWSPVGVSPTSDAWRDLERQVQEHRAAQAQAKEEPDLPSVITLNGYALSVEDARGLIDVLGERGEKIEDDGVRDVHLVGGDRVVHVEPASTSAKEDRGARHFVTMDNATVGLYVPGKEWDLFVAETKAVAGYEAMQAEQEADVSREPMIDFPRASASLYRPLIRIPLSIAQEVVTQLFPTVDGDWAHVRKSAWERTWHWNGKARLYMHSAEGSLNVTVRIYDDTFGVLRTYTLGSSLFTRLREDVQAAERRMNTTTSLVGARGTVRVGPISMPAAVAQDFLNFLTYAPDQKVTCGQWQLKLLPKRVTVTAPAGWSWTFYDKPMLESAFQEALTSGEAEVAVDAIEFPDGPVRAVKFSPEPAATREPAPSTGTAQFPAPLSASWEIPLDVAAGLVDWLEFAQPAPGDELQLDADRLVRIGAMSGAATRLDFEDSAAKTMLWTDAPAWQLIATQVKERYVRSPYSCRKQVGADGTTRWTLFPPTTQKENDMDNHEENHDENEESLWSEQAEELGDALALGLKLGGTQIASNALMNLAQDLSKDIPWLADMLKTPQGREGAKLVLALLAHTAAVHKPGVVPKADLVRSGAQLQMTASTSTLLVATLPLVQKHAKQLMEVAEKLALSATEEGQRKLVQARVAVDEDEAEDEIDEEAVEAELHDLKSRSSA